MKVHVVYKNRLIYSKLNIVVFNKTSSMVALRLIPSVDFVGQSSDRRESKKYKYQLSTFIMK